MKREPAHADAFPTSQHPMVTSPAIVMERATPEQYEALRMSLKMSAKAGTPVIMSPRDTSFMPEEGMSKDEYDSLVEGQVIATIKAVPTHY